jgi:hypothetical protein
LVFGLSFASLGVLGWLDYTTGYELGFFVFYSVPVGLAAWYAGRWPAIGVALGATVTWLLADSLSGAKYSALFYYYWNSMIHFFAFVINAVTIAKIKSDLDQQHRLARELDAARELLRRVAEKSDVCPVCGQPRFSPPLERNSAGSGSSQVCGVSEQVCLEYHVRVTTGAFGGASCSGTRLSP